MVGWWTVLLSVIGWVEVKTRSLILCPVAGGSAFASVMRELGWLFLLRDSKFGGCKVFA